MQSTLGTLRVKIPGEVEIYASFTFHIATRTIHHLLVSDSRKYHPLPSVIQQFLVSPDQRRNFSWKNSTFSLRSTSNQLDVASFVIFLFLSGKNSQECFCMYHVALVRAVPALSWNTEADGGGGVQPLVDFKEGRKPREPPGISWESLNRHDEYFSRSADYHKKWDCVWNIYEPLLDQYRSRLLKYTRNRFKTAVISFKNLSIAKYVLRVSSLLVAVMDAYIHIFIHI